MGGGVMLCYLFQKEMVNFCKYFTFLKLIHYSLKYVAFLTLKNWNSNRSKIKTRTV